MIILVNRLQITILIFLLQLSFSWDMTLSIYDTNDEAANDYLQLGTCEGCHDGFHYGEDGYDIPTLATPYTDIQFFNLEWVGIIDSNGKILSENIDNFSYASIYDLKRIKNLYSNLDTISFWGIKNEIKLLEERGYSTRQMKTKLQKSLAFPFFLLAMVLLSGVFALGTNFKENNLIYVFFTIISCVLIYFFNDFSAALGKTEKLAVEVAVWMPIIIIFIFSAVGIIYANQK